ncbi:MAG: hypothetical protein ACRELS_07120 [Candidatus Rokuibacteriota bacterium]
MIRAGVLVGLAVVGVVVAALLPPIPQDLGYHAFADRRTLAGVPNALNVLSNVVFLAVGVAGLVRLASRRARDWDAAAAGILFAGVAGTSVGSAWYHLAPDNARLVWDRLPMTVVFMTFLALVVADRVGARAGRTLLPPLLIAGLASVGYWALIDDDLRAYGLVQFFPMLAIPFLMLAFPSARARDGDLWWAIVCYGASKVTEHADGAIFALGGIVSGHTLKHVLAGLGAAFILRWIVRRPSESP